MYWKKKMYKKPCLPTHTCNTELVLYSYTEGMKWQSKHAVALSIFYYDLQWYPTTQLLHLDLYWINGTSP